MIEEPDSAYAGFISYRRENGAHAARLIKLMVERYSDKKLFLDVDELGIGRFDNRLLKVIESAPAFILVMSPGCLDRCVDPKDWLRREIQHALTLKKMFLPILVDHFAFPPTEIWDRLPSEMAELPNYQAVVYEHQFAEPAARKVIRFINELRVVASPEGTTGRDTGGQKRARLSRATTDPVISMAVPPSGDVLVESDAHGNLSCWSLADWTVLSRHNLGVSCDLQISPNSRTLVAWSKLDDDFQAQLSILSLPELEVRGRVMFSGGLSSWKMTPMFSRDGTRFGATTQIIRLLGQGTRTGCDAITSWDLGSLASVRADLPEMGCFRLRALSEDGQTAAVDANVLPGTQLWLVDLLSGNVIRRYRTGKGFEVNVLTSDWQTIVCATRDGRLEIRDARSDEVRATSGRETARYSGYSSHWDSVALALSPSEEVCLWAHDWGQVRLFSVPAAAELAAFDTINLQGRAIQCAFAPDSSLVCAYPTVFPHDPVDANGVLKIWSMDGQAVARLSEVRNVMKASFLSGRFLALESKGRIVVWNTERWTAECQFLPNESRWVGFDG